MYIIVEWFKKNYPELVKQMKECDHDISLEEQSKYHTEGDVYTHTMMVCSHLAQYNDHNLFIAGLFHDIGKPKTRHKKATKNSMSFTKHDSISAFMALDMLDKLKEDLHIEINKEMIIKAIYMHQFFHPIGEFVEGEFFLDEESKININKIFGDDLEFYEFLLKLGKADIKGRISFDMEESVKRYEFFESYIPYEYHSKEEGLPKAYMLTGLPTAGKSEFIKANFNDIEVLSTDDIMKTFVKGDLPYNMYFSPKNVEKAEVMIYERMKELIIQRKSFIIDQTNMTERVRNRKASIIPDKYYEKISVVCFVGEKELLKRNDKRKKEGKFIDVDTLWYKIKEFELPKKDIFDKVLFKFS